MVVREFYMERADGVKLYRTYSDIGHMLRQAQTGTEYPEAIDVESAKYTYEETDVLIEEEYDETADMKEALNILLGDGGGEQ